MLSSRSFYLKRGGSMDGKGRILFWIKAVQQVFCHLHENVGNGQPSGSINRELDERNKVCWILHVSLVIYWEKGSIPCFLWKWKVILASQGQVLESGEKRWLIRRQEETSSWQHITLSPSTLQLVPLLLLLLALVELWIILL